MRILTESFSITWRTEHLFFVKTSDEATIIMTLTLRWCHKVQFDLGLVLQGQPLDGDEAVGLVVADYHPPALLTFLKQSQSKTITWKNTQKMCVTLHNNCGCAIS